MEPGDKEGLSPCPSLSHKQLVSISPPGSMRRNFLVSLPFSLGPNLMQGSPRQPVLPF